MGETGPPGRPGSINPFAILNGVDGERWEASRLTRVGGAAEVIRPWRVTGPLWAILGAAVSGVTAASCGCGSTR